MPRGRISGFIQMGPIGVSDTRVHRRMAWVGGFLLKSDGSGSAQYEVARPAKPAQRTVPQGDKPVPEPRKPGQFQKLRFDDFEQPLDDKEARRISANDDHGAGDPVSLARNSHRSKLEWLDEARRNREHKQ